MIFRKALWRELANDCLVAFVVLLVIVLTMRLIVILGRAARGEVAAESVFAYLGFSLLDHLPILLSLALFIAVLMTLSRAYRDSEMTVWFSTGLALTSFIRPVLGFALPVVALIAILSMVMLPWSAERREHFRRALESRNDTSVFAPGVFSESARADRVFFVESLGAVGTEVRNVFVQSADGDNLEVVVAARGFHDVTEKGDRFLVLVNGRRYSGVVGGAEFSTAEFGRYNVRIQPSPVSERAADARALSTPELIARGRPRDRAELIWRVGNPVGALVLSLMAIPLSFVNPRAGRSANLVLAVFVYLIYNNLIGISEAWIAQQKLSASFGFIGVHGLMMAALVALFYFRMAGKPMTRRR